jgi:hypothetical protein
MARPVEAAMTAPDPWPVAFWATLAFMTILALVALA